MTRSADAHSFGLSLSGAPVQPSCLFNAIGVPQEGPFSPILA
jgi:hypothetical protein